VIVVHILQWVFIAVCVPLFGLLLFSLIKAWREQPAATFARTPPDVAAAEYRRGYSDGWSDGADYTNEENRDQAAEANCCSMTSSDDDGEVSS
jgi:hypothetical protein